MTEDNSKFNSIWLIVALALLMYVLPWVFNPGTSLSIAAYDFAEFLAKRPFDTAGYYVIFALRGQLLLLALLIAITAHRPYFTAHWWSLVIACTVLVIAQMPPVTFINNMNDMNQQQQAYLTIGSLIGVSIGLSGIVWKQRRILSLIIGIIGIVSVCYSLFHAINIMNDYAILANVGIGGIGLIIVYLLVCIISTRQILQKQTNRTAK